MNPPETVDADCLGGDADEEEVCQCQGVVFDDGVLEGSDYGYSCIEGVTKEEVSCESIVNCWMEVEKEFCPYRLDIGGFV